MAEYRKTKYIVGDVYEVNGGTMEMVALDTSNTSHCRYVWIMWLDEHKYVQKVRVDTIKSGSIRNPFKRTVEGVGYLGVGVHKNSNRDKYNSWASMIARCHRPQLKEKYPRYELCVTSEEWRCYQSFGDFYEADIYRKKGWHLDKDLLIPDNKLYSKDTCAYLPQELNCMSFYKESTNATGFKGVWFDPQCKKYMASATYHGDNRSTTLGRYKTVEEAFYAVMLAESEIYKTAANKWEGKIDPRATEALLNISQLKLGRIK